MNFVDLLNFSKAFDLNMFSRIKKGFADADRNKKKSKYSLHDYEYISLFFSSFYSLN